MEETMKKYNKTKSDNPPAKAIIRNGEVAYENVDPRRKSVFEKMCAKRGINITGKDVDLEQLTNTMLANLSVNFTNEENKNKILNCLAEFLKKEGYKWTSND